MEHVNNDTSIKHALVNNHTLAAKVKHRASYHWNILLNFVRPLKKLPNN